MNIYLALGAAPTQFTDPYGQAPITHTCTSGRQVTMDVSHCNQQQMPVIKAAVCEAAATSDAAFDILFQYHSSLANNPTWPPTDKRKLCVLKALNDFFNITQPTAMHPGFQTIGGVVGDTAGLFGGTINIECETWCSGGKKAYVYKGYDTIHICPNDIPHLPVLCGSLANTLIHEATHAAAGTDDDGGYVDGQDKFGSTLYDVGGSLVHIPDDTALNNADTYTYFIRALSKCSKLQP